MLVVQEDPRFAQGVKIRKPEFRLRYFMQQCASKRFDEATGSPQPVSLGLAWLQVGMAAVS